MKLVLTLLTAFLAISLLSILDTSPGPLHKDVITPYNQYENVVVYNMIIEQSQKLINILEAQRENGSL